MLLNTYPLPAIPLGNPTVVGNSEVVVSKQEHENLEIDEAVLTAWRQIKAADAAIASQIARGQTTGIADQAVVIKTTVLDIADRISVPDEHMKKRLDSVVRQVVALADKLRIAAATTKASRVEIVYSNLHKYVVFAESHFPLSDTQGNHRMSDAP